MKFLIDVLKYVKYVLYRMVSLLYQIKFRKIKILSDEETINYIIKNNISYSRYGDGEFNWILNNKQNSFQDDNKIMSDRMKEILLNHNNNVLIGIPLGLKKVSEFNLYSKKFWTYTFVKNYKKLLRNIPNGIYGNASVTRPYIDYKDKRDSQKKFDNLRKLWNNRKIVLVEGEKTKIGVGNDLLDNAKSIERIICPSRNAFNKYDEILNKIIENISKDKLILIALGPTATVLAYDLGQIGYQAIDIGHIDVEYVWFKLGVTERTSIAGKQVNECKNDISENIVIEDEEYEKSIIMRIL